MNKYKRKSKSKTLALGIGILSSAAVVSTGFAAWIIAGGDSVTGTGSITADTIENHEHTFGGALVENKNLGDVFFGAPKTISDGAWLSNDKANAEKLTLSTTFTVDHIETISDTPANTSAWLGNLFDDSKSSFTETDGSTYSTAANGIDYNGTTKKLVGALPKIIFGGEVSSAAPGVYVTYKSVDDTDTKNHIGTFGLDIVFTWGDAFGSKNPYDYYNDQTKTSDLSKEAFALLDATHNINAKFSLTLVTK